MKVINMNKLKPCPFCGRKASIKEYDNAYKSDGLYVASYRVGCNTCKIYFYRNSEFRFVDGQLKFKVNGYDSAINLWNTRAKIVDNSEDVNSFVI